MKRFTTFCIMMLMTVTLILIMASCDWVERLDWWGINPGDVRATEAVDVEK